MRIHSVPLDPTVRCQDALDFELALREKIVGQEEAIIKSAEAVHKYMAGFSAPGRPLANILFLGPTGTGKTRVVEAIAEVLLNDSKAVIKIDCSEFQASHDISKIIGAPPGYVGHNDRNTRPLINQERLDKYKVEGKKVAILLFDEIEKASSALWNLLLGITDKATLTTGAGDVLDFSNCFIFMTSNLGASQISKELAGGLGFAQKDESGQLDIKLSKAATEAARKNFTPEFMNRLDHSVVFHTLQREHLEKIFKIEVNAIQRRVLMADNHIKFAISYSPEAADFLLSKGTDTKSGARELKRVLEQYVVNPVSHLVMTGQLEFGDLLLVQTKDHDLTFDKIPADVIKNTQGEEWTDFKQAGA